MKIPRFFWIWLGLPFLWACQPEEATPIPGKLHYEFFANDDDHKAVDAGLHDLLGRLGPHARLHGAFQNCSHPAAVQPVLDSLAATPGSRLVLLLDGPHWDHSTAPEQQWVRDKIREVSHRTGQIWVENDRNPRAGRLGPWIADPSLRQQNNFLLIDSVRPAPGDDLGPAVLLFSQGWEMGWASPGNHALAIYGDPGLYNGFLEYWNQMAESRIDFAFHSVRTFSNVHDHAAWFYPLFEGEDPTLGLLDQLDSGIVRNGQPAKIYLAQRSFAGQEALLGRLRRLSNKLQADVRLISGDSVPVWEDHILQVRPELPSSLWLIQGPLLPDAGAAPERRWLVGMGSHGWNPEDLGRHSNSIVVVDDQALFEEVERHWLYWWEGWK